MALTRASANMESTKEASALFRILDLPPELIDNICRELDDDDLLSVHKVSQAIGAHSSTAFGIRFFHHLILILHPTSLAVFLEISRHSRWSKFVRKVSVSGELIGTTIFPDNLDIRPHVDLQKSVEKSGMDLLILEQAFRVLGSLEDVRLDVASFNADEAHGYFADGIKCGRKHMFDEKDAKTIPDNEPGLNYTRVYQLAFQALQQAGVHKKVKLSLHFSYINDNEEISFFNVQSPEWTATFGPNLRYISCLGSFNTGWMSILLQSTGTLFRVEFQGNHEHIALPYRSGEKHFRPTLSHLHLDEVTVRHAEIVPFLREHSSTMVDLHLQSIGLPDGSWVEPLHVMKSMPKLQYLFLNALGEREAYGSLSQDFEDMASHDPYGFFQTFSIDETTTILAALCSDVRTKSGPPFPLEAQEIIYHYEVDLRKAKAAGDGEIVFLDGRWQRTTDWSSDSSDDPETD